MKKPSLLLIATVLISFNFYKLNETHHILYKTISPKSIVEWKAWHIGKVGERYGKVSIKNGEIYTKDNQIYSGKFTLDLENLTVENFKEDTTKNEQLKRHLKSEDFFKTDSFPTATFEITDAKAIEGNFNTLLGGNLKIKDVNKNIQFKVLFKENEKGITLKSEAFEIDRTNWGLLYHSSESSGVLSDYLIANEIALIINLEMTY